MRSCTTLLITAALFFACVPAEATNLFGAVTFSTDFSGDAAYGLAWNTLGGDSVYNLYLDQGSGFINSGDGPSTSINVALTPGAYTFGIYGDGFESNLTWGLNLFFDGDITDPGISAFNSNGGVGTSAFADCGSTITLAAASVAGACSLVFDDGTNSVALTSYTFNDVSGVDRVSPFSTTVNGTDDFVGSFTLVVTADGTATIPEPGSALLSGAGLAAILRLARKCSRTT